MDERWLHITTEHSELSELRDEVLEAVRNPERILQGGDGALLAVQAVEADKWLIVVYRENEDDGFIITAFVTCRKRSLDKRKIVWTR